MNDFSPLTEKVSHAEQLSGAPLSYRRDAWLRLQQNRAAVIAAAFLALLAFCAIAIPLVSLELYYDTNLAIKNQAPSLEHWFGTDDLGRDLWIRVWHGARISLFIGITAALIDLAIGILWGGIAAMSGGRVDEIMMRFADTLYGLPYLLVVILLMVVLGNGLLPILIALTVIGWIPMARIVRGQLLQLMQQDYVLAARSMGATRSRLLFVHLLPNAIGPILVTVTLTVPTAIFVEALLSFLGLGVQAPIASWGTLANDGLSALRFYPWRIAFPAAFISCTMLAFNVLGDGLRDALDPRLRGVHAPR